MVDAEHSKCFVRKGVWVRIPHPAPREVAWVRWPPPFGERDSGSGWNQSKHGIHRGLNQCGIDKPS